MARISLPSSSYVDFIRIDSEPFERLVGELMDSDYTWHVSNGNKPLKRSLLHDPNCMSVPVPSDARGYKPAKGTPKMIVKKMSGGVAYNPSIDRYPALVAAKYDDGMFYVGIVDVSKMPGAGEHTLTLFRHVKDDLTEIFKNYKPAMVLVKPSR